MAVNRLDADNRHYPDVHSSDHLIHPRYRADIDGLRAIAVLSVIGFHAFPNWIRGGFIGVDVFFVISGFLISTIIFDSLERNRFSFIEFYGRRIRRIFPALLLVLAASYAVGWFELLAEEYKQLGKHIAGGAGFVSNFVLWNESGYFDNAAESKPLLHLWSLGIEEQFYIFWPLLLWFTWKRRLSLLSTTIAIAVISFAVSIDTAGSNAVAAFYSPLTRCWELMSGSVLAYITARGPTTVSSLKQWLDRREGAFGYRRVTGTNRDILCGIQSAAGVALIVAAALVINKDVRFPGWWALLPIAGTVMIIAAGAQAWPNRTVLSNRWLVWFGLISFPLYLWHWPLLSFARIMEGKAPSDAIRIAAVLLAILLAWLTYQLLETPCRLGGHRRAKTFALVASMMVVGYLGYDCDIHDGLGFRFPKIVQDLTNFSYDYKTGYREGACFLRADQDYSAFASCESPSDPARTRSILIWGDSHAAHLYPGYQAAFGTEFKIIQRTASNCPPILNMEIDNRPHCQEINDHILESIRKEKPDKIVLAANWSRYDWKKIDGTIAQLRSLGMTNIDLMGPLPQWVGGLPRQLYLNFKADKSRPVPERMTSGLNPDFMRMDALLSDYAGRSNVNYISAQKIFCNELGCVTRLGETGESVTFWDCCHLTAAGSRFLASKISQNTGFSPPNSGSPVIDVNPAWRKRPPITGF